MVGEKRPVLWSPEALNDIDALWDYYARTAGHVTADKILREVARIVATIDDFPLAGRGVVMKSEQVCARCPPVLKSSFTV